jgi:hypothetical protein
MGYGGPKLCGKKWCYREDYMHKKGSFRISPFFATEQEGFEFHDWFAENLDLFKDDIADYVPTDFVKNADLRNYTAEFNGKKYTCINKMTKEWNKFKKVSYGIQSN